MLLIARLPFLCLTRPDPPDYNKQRLMESAADPALGRYNVSFLPDRKILPCFASILVLLPVIAMA